MLCSCVSRKNICTSEWQKATEWRRAARRLRRTPTQCIMPWDHVSTCSFAQAPDKCSVRHIAFTSCLLSIYGNVYWFLYKRLATFRLLCVYIVMMISQVLATLPVTGACRKSYVERVHFSWCTLISFLSVIMIVFSLTDVVLSTKVVMEFGLKLYTVGKILMKICSSKFKFPIIDMYIYTLTLFGCRSFQL